jgi:hypothetical protein
MTALVLAQWVGPRVTVFAYRKANCKVARKSSRLSCLSGKVSTRQQSSKDSARGREGGRE